MYRQVIRYVSSILQERNLKLRIYCNAPINSDHKYRGYATKCEDQQQ
jgi:hypothetical protein